MARDQSAAPIMRNSCGQTGSAEWAWHRRFGSGVDFRRRLVLLSSGFRNEFASIPLLDPKIVCEAYGTTLLEREPG